jgi:hypothetical protein
VLVGRGQTCCLDGISGGTQGVRSHVGNGRGLPRGSGGCGSGRCLHVTSGAGTDEPPADLRGDIKLTTSEGSRPRDCVPGAAILWSLRLELSLAGRGSSFCRPEVFRFRRGPGDTQPPLAPTGG